jgi:hypothetical protein
MTETPFHIFGIRHHGPGCARSLVQALEALQPDCLLIEGPPEADELLGFVTDPAMQPPVALLVYRPENPADAAFYPFAEFSPEWQALRYGVSQGIPTRFMDLPQAHQLGVATVPVEAADSEDSEPEPEQGPSPPEAALPLHDPIGWLGQAAGYGDGEAWWNHQVEERGDGEGLFVAIREAMTAVREEATAAGHGLHRGEAGRLREARREAHMRKTLRAAQKEGFARIAVVCGAWHLPALERMPPAKADNELLKGLPKNKVEAAWVPWSNGSLSRDGGYGAGVTAPGWYEHLWHTRNPHHRLVGWLAKVARLLRAEDLDCSSAHIIETVRLAESLAALRERPAAGLGEIEEAVRSVICQGEEAPMALIERRLKIGERLGAVPPSVPVTPLQRDLAQQQRSLRLKPEATNKTLDLDLRQPNDLARSHLLHRLDLLGLPWGRMERTGRSAKGTFHELWTLRWQPEFAVAIVEASRWGGSVEGAAAARAVALAREAGDLGTLAALVDRVLLADLEAAVTPVVQALEALAAVSADQLQLLDAIPPLANIFRYGNVRRTDTGLVAHLLDGLVARACVGLSAACAALDEEAAAAMRPRLLGVHQAIKLLDQPDHTADWLQALGRLAELAGGPGLVSGLAARLRLDAGADDLDSTARRLSQALSIGADPTPAAAWLEGFLNQSGMVLLHDDRLWQVVDGWVSGLGGDDFVRVLPLVRRTFATFSGPERQQLGGRARRPTSKAGAAPVTGELDWDMGRAERPVGLLRLLVGVAT